MTRVLDGFARLVSGRVSAWVLIVVAVLGSAAAIALSPEGRTTDAPTAGLPDSAQSTQVAALQQQLPSGQLNPAVVVYSRPGGLSDADLAVIAAQAVTLRSRGGGGAALWNCAGGGDGGVGQTDS
jgi:RND superfamily putative drug exporter